MIRCAEVHDERYALCEGTQGMILDEAVVKRATRLRTSVAGSALLLAAALSVVSYSTASAETRHGSEEVPRKDRPAIVVFGASYAKNWSIRELDGLRVINKGVGGDETRGMLARFDGDVVASRPSAVLIWGFINDIFRSPRDQLASTSRHTRGNILNMLDKARKAGIRTILATEVTITSPAGFKEALARWYGSLRGKEGYHGYVNRYVRETNVWIRAVAAEQHIPLLDFEMVLDDGNGERRREYATEDGSHLSAAAYAALTAYTSGKIGSALGR